MKIVAISDTHSRRPEIPPGDVLLHAGDITGKNRTQGHLWNIVEQEFNWLAEVKEKKKFKHVALIAGNHDFCAEDDPKHFRELAEKRGLIYLYNETVLLDGVSIWGSPYTPWFHDWAFNVMGPSINDIWDSIPKSTNIVLTHTPPRDILDLTFLSYEHVGCPWLCNQILNRIKPKFHVFGHIHERYGRLHYKGTEFINAASCNLSYRAVNPPMEFEIE